MLSVNGVDLYVEAKGSGKTILFLHPPVLSGEVFRPQFEELCDAYQVLMLDLRGHGRSAPSLVPWNFSDIVRDIKEVLDTLGLGQVWLCGYSSGASVAFEFSLQFPERVEGLIQVGAVPKVRGIIKMLAQAGAKMSRKHMVPLLALGGAFLNTDEFRLFWGLFRTARRTNGLDAVSFYRSYCTYECKKRLWMLDKPVLLVYGESDRLFKVYAKRMARQLPNCQVAFIAKARHEIPGNQSAELNVLIRNFVK
ncbi:MAG: alpha/beta fold hydrolase [Ectobacillus sp.]